jgi:hypothetical protein
MWNEAGVAVGGEGGHVVHVGRSWFRMTPTAATAVADGDGDGIAQPASATKTARIGLGHPEVLEAAPVTPPRSVEWDAVASRGTVTVSWWLLGVFATALLATGAVATAAMLRPRIAPAIAPAVLALPPVPPPPTVIVEQLPSPPPSPTSEAATAEEPAPVVRPAPVRRARLSPPKRSTASAPREPSALPSTTWVDPFAD